MGRNASTFATYLQRKTAFGVKDGFVERPRLQSVMMLAVRPPSRTHVCVPSTASEQTDDSNPGHSKFITTSTHQISQVLPQCDSFSHMRRALALAPSAVEGDTPGRAATNENVQSTTHVHCATSEPRRRWCDHLPDPNHTAMRLLLEC